MRTQIYRLTGKRWSKPRQQLKKGQKVHPKDLVAPSVFTTQSVTAVLEKIRDEIKAEVPAPANFLLGPGGTRTVFTLSNVSSMALNLDRVTSPGRAWNLCRLCLTATCATGNSWCGWHDCLRQICLAEL